MYYIHQEVNPQAPQREILYFDELPHGVHRHEAEDWDRYPRVLYQSNGEQLRHPHSTLSNAIYFSKTLGTKVTNNSLALNDPKNSLEGRMATFPVEWNKTARKEWASAGFHYTGNDQVICHWCHLSFRDMDSPEVCPWTRHKEVAYNCGALKRVVADGPHPTPPGKRVRICSTSAAERMTG